MGNAVTDVVNNITEQIERGAIGPNYYKVFNIPVGFFDPPINPIFENNGAISIRDFETNDKWKNSSRVKEDWQACWTALHA